jgi:hypothetical protein
MDDHHVSKARLQQLLARGAEADELDYKQACDLSDGRDLVKLAKHVAAMTAFGGHIVIGVDGHGKPMGTVPSGAATAFDPVRLRAKLKKWLPDELEVHSQTWEIDGNLVVVIYVADGRDGPLHLHADGFYIDSSGVRQDVFRAGESYYRSGTSDTVVRAGDQAFMKRLLEHHRRRLTAGHTPAPVSAPVDPNALDPTALSAHVLDLLDARATVRLRELLKSERRRFEETLKSLVEERAQSDPNVDDEYLTFEAAAIPAIDRYLATLFPLIEHQSELANEQVAELERIANAEYTRAPYPTWNDLSRWAAWAVAEAIGAFAVSQNNLTVVRALFDTAIFQTVATTAFPVMFIPEGMRRMIAASARAQGKAERPTAPQFPHLIQVLAGSATFRAVAPEFCEAVAQWIYDYDFLAMFSAASRLPPRRRIVAAWSATHDGGRTMARRLRDDDSFRVMVMNEVFGLDADDYVRKMTEWWDQLAQGQIVYPDGFGSSNAIAILAGEEH